MKNALALCCLALLAWAAPAHGLPIPTLFSTGFDQNGQLLLSGPDPHYTLLKVDAPDWSTAGDGSAPPAALSNQATFDPPMQANVQEYTHGAWVPSSDLSRWVSYEGTMGWSQFYYGLYTYQTTFDLTGLDPASVQLSGIWGTDDPGWAYLNLDDPNVPDPAKLVIGGGGFGALPAWSIDGSNGLFKPGLNTITFVVWDGGMCVTGLRFQVDSASAEPAVRTVAVDVQPGDATSTVNPASTGLLPAAILGAADFDAASVDPATVLIAGRPVATRKNGTLMASLADVNLDGLADLVLHTPVMGLSFGPAGEVVVTGTTSAGLDVRGVDVVRLLDP